MGNLVKSFLSQDDLKAVGDVIADVEKRTSGEVRVAIRQKKERKERSLALEQLARMEFTRLGMERTQERTGVLIFIVLEDRSFYILADEHINQKVSQNTWSMVAAQMSDSFAKKEFRQGVANAVRSVGDLLAVHFPVRQGDRNELSNDVAVS